MNFKNLLVFSLLLCSLSANAQVTRVQFINNCPDINLQAIDIYIDGVLTVNDLFFRHSEAFMDLPANTPIEIGFAENVSLNVADTFMNRQMTLSPTSQYIIVADGVNSLTGYSPNLKFTLHIYSNASESTTPGNTSMLFLNGSTDVGTTMDFRTGLDVIANDIAYGNFSNGYSTLPSSGVYIFRETNTTGSKTIRNFDADFSSLPLSGKAVTVITSGFINPANNSNGEPYGLWLSVPTGGPMIELPLTTTAEKLARVQVIHNIADTAVGKMDVYANNQKIIDSLDYRHATPYMDAYAGTVLNIGFAQVGSGTQYYNTNVTLDSGKTYAAVLNGILSDTNYIPLPPLSIDLYGNAREEATVATSTDVLYMHGSTDGPLTDIRKGDNSALFTNLSYGDFSMGYATITQGEFPMIKIDTGNANTYMEKYEIKISNWNLAGKSATVVFSGFIEPDSNSGGPMYSLWAAMPEGGAMRELPVYVSVDGITKNATKINLYPNPAINEITFTTTSAKNNILITDATGKVVKQLSSYSGKRINVNSLATGTYIFIMQNEKGEMYYGKFLKQ